MKHFIIGYGSLICPDSRAITSPALRNAKAEPVVIHNLERAWSARVANESIFSKDVDVMPNMEHIRGWTPVGVRVRPGAKCNGVLIHVEEEDLMRFDVREEGYERRKIDVADIQPHYENIPIADMTQHLQDLDVQSFALDRVICHECRLVLQRGYERRQQLSGSETAVESANMPDESSDVLVWVYIPTEVLPPNRAFPITQSYVDIILRGCLSISPAFAHGFLETTTGWWHDGQSNDAYVNKEQTTSPKSCEVSTGHICYHHTWVNDRQSPIYARADSDYSLENGEYIDKLIEKHHYSAVKRRVMVP